MILFMSDRATRAEYRLPGAFIRDLEFLLVQYPQGISEYDLLQALREQGYFSFMSERPVPPMALFQSHFLLFHALYRLQKEYLQKQSSLLEVSPLNIQLRDYQPGEAGLSLTDPVRDYYLDLSNLDNMTEAGVDDLIQAFWQDFERRDDRATALAELGLSDPVDEVTIRQAYRRLAMLHHPDRGGAARRLQIINAAYALLCKSRS
ncbi:MAG: DNA-J related domain-containing protein [Pseudohongiellaceae bacterium]